MCSSCPELTPAQRDALALDEALVPVARGQGVVELAIGATLGLLFTGDRLAQLGCSREADYARERMGVPPSTMFQWLRLARELEHRPLLRAAVGKGLVSTRKALAVLPLAEGDLEAAWTKAAMRITLREISSAVRAAGKEDPEERFECESIVLPMNAEQQARLDAALALAKMSIGPEARRWQCMEAICQEWFSGHGEWEGERKGGGGAEDERKEGERKGGGGHEGGCNGDGRNESGPKGGGGARPSPAPPPDPRQSKLLARQIAAVEEANGVVAEIGKEPLPEDALGLHARVLRLLKARREWDESLGVLLLRARDKCVHEVLGYGSFAAYCEERLGMRAATARQRIWLERRMQDMPALREALKSGRLTYSKALAVARQATPFDVDDRIERAAATTCQQTEKEGEAEEDRKNRGAEVRKVWAPKDAAETVREAIASAQAWSLGERGVGIDEGEALAVIADHFVEVCEAHEPPGRRRWVDQLRREVLTRKAGLCAVPGCSRASVHLHHVVFRSRGGGDEPWNLVGLCACHHLHGIHVGYLEVTGRAGERLYWKLGTGEVVPLEEWVTFGDDDVWRADAAAADAAAADAAAAANEAAAEPSEGPPAEPSAPAGATDVEFAASGGADITNVEFDGAGFVAEHAPPYAASLDSESASDDSDIVRRSDAA
jgi:hypothetical protein